MPSTWAKLTLIVLLGASLGLKTWRSAAADQPIAPPGRGAFFDTLSADGFALAEAGGLQGPSWIAEKGACHIEINPVSPLGWHQSAMSTRAAGQALAYVYQKAVYPDQPVLLTKRDYYWHKLANYFYPSAPPPVFAVVTSGGCAAEPIDVPRLARLLP